MAGKNRVSRVPPAGKDKSDPGPRKVSEAGQRGARPGQAAPARATGNAGGAPQRGVTTVPMKPGRAGLRDMTGAGTIFDRADAGNRRLGGRNR